VKDFRGSVKKIRILLVNGSLVPGGIEMWLMNVMRAIDRNRFEVDLALSNTVRSQMTEEAEALGTRIHICRPQSRPWEYAYNLTRLLRKEGPYDVIHSNLHHLNGVVCLSAALAGVPVRIVHSHTLLSGTESLRYRAARWTIRKFANGAIGCSEAAGDALFGKDWQRALDGRVLYCGINVEQFRTLPDPHALRASFGIPADAVVVGHVGRFVPEKNHSFWFDIAQAYAHKNPRAHFLLLGDGVLWKQMKERAAASPFADRFHLPGVRYDVAQLLSAMDAFLFPSVVEGLPVALVEAQAAGLPCIYSDFITPEVDVNPEMLCRISLKEPAEVWAQGIERMVSTLTPATRSSAFRAVEASPFNLARSLRELQDYYVRLSEQHGVATRVQQPLEAAAQR
jgi:glycosyltransferase involved in cell wall biosynthesis